MCEGEISPDARETEIGGLPARYQLRSKQFHKTLSPQRRPQRKADLTEYMRVIVLRITSQQFSFINQDGGSGCENRCRVNYGEEVKDKHGLLVQR